MNRWPIKRKAPPPEDTVRVTCPACGGRKGGHVPADWKAPATEEPTDPTLVFDACRFCSGEGVVGERYSRIHEQRRQLGRSMCRERMQRKVGLRAEACRRKMSIADLIAEENGESEPKPQPPIWRA